MRKLSTIFLMCFILLPMFAQTKQNGTIYESQNNYQRIVREILNDDDLFVLFYTNLALVVDPNLNTQIVVEVSTDNPWFSLKEYLYGKSNIYFCPSNLYLNKAIEYMPCPLDNHVLMSDQYGMYRLSSPKELFKNYGDGFKNTQHKALVFGGLNYDEYQDTSDEMLAFRGDEREAMNGYRFLKSTYDEAIYIDSIFRKNKIETSLLTDKKGTEERFYQIPNYGIDILHIASHGFYKPDKHKEDSRTLQEWMMSHSGLILSGADEDLDNQKYDGRLTAYEISQTDLSGVNLVVLSACNTGLGDIKENDTYGLLKGFKDAHAGTLLVSLSAVNDFATSVLMKRFYENLFRGDNPRRALENAQRYIRLYDKGKYNDPNYWASFILVDDLDRNVGANVSEECKQAFLDEIVGMNDIYSENMLFPNWDRIRKKLTKDDVIIRVFPYLAQEKTEYVAMIGDVKTGKSSVVHLFSMNEAIIDDLNETYDYMYGSYSFDKTDSLLWLKVLPYMTGKKNVYLQLAGVFSNLPVEYSPMVSDKFQIYRISSLNVLLEKKKHLAQINTIALFGGLCYDLNDSIFNNGDALTRKFHYGLSYLSGTKTETDSIASLFMNDNVLLFQCESGNESSFCSLSNKNIQVIHIASHAYSIENPSESSFLDYNSYSIIDYLFNRTMIFFSGANHALLGDQITPDFDGILTGAEISKLNFCNADLVVLSTCNSAKNILSSNATDNAWSIANAFKKAGAKAILASIGVVDDKSTCILMIQFYKNLKQGMRKIEALREAQKYLQKDIIYGSDPQYWARFILLDALD